jgi:hypothetical protein
MGTGMPRRRLLGARQQQMFGESSASTTTGSETA